MVFICAFGSVFGWLDVTPNSLTEELLSSQQHMVTRWLWPQSPSHNHFPSRLFSWSGCEPLQKHMTTHGALLMLPSGCSINGREHLCVSVLQLVAEVAVQTVSLTKIATTDIGIELSASSNHIVVIACFSTNTGFALQIIHVNAASTIRGSGVISRSIGLLAFLSFLAVVSSFFLCEHFRVMLTVFFRLT